MPIYDRQCENGHNTLDCYEPMEAPDFPCPDCSSPTTRVWLNHANGVIPDDIPGGIEIRHGLCNPDGTPHRYYSKSEMAKEAKRRGLTNIVEHVGDKGSDKSKHTSKWV